MKHSVLLNVEITPNCPAACAMCPRSLVADAGFMTNETAQLVADSIDPSFTWEIDFAGRGEPTIHPRLFDIAEIFGAVGAPLGIVTTGVKVNTRTLDAFERDFDIIRLSVSSIDRATFDRVHIGLDHAQIWDNIAALAEVAAPKTVIHLTGGPTIYDHLPETVDHLRSLGYEQFRLLTLWNRGGHFETSQDRVRRRELMQSLELPPSENEAWTGTGKVRFLTGLATARLRNRDFCPIGNSSLSIAWDGKILGCFQDFGHTSIVGSVDTTDLKEHLRARVQQLGRMPVCEGCDANEVTLFSLSRT